MLGSNGYRRASHCFKRGALPEVVGDAGLLIEDPLDARELGRSNLPD